MATATRRRRPKLRVIGDDRRPARHRLLYGSWPTGFVVEFWSEAEFAALAPWEMPDIRYTGWLPGTGHLIKRDIESKEEEEEILAEQAAQVQDWKAVRGIE